MPRPLREHLEPEGIIHVAERVGVRQRLDALLPTIPRLKGPAIDEHWGAAPEGPAKVGISDSGLLLELDLSRVDTRFHGHLSLHYKTSIPDDVLTALPTRSLAFAVSPNTSSTCLVCGCATDHSVSVAGSTSSTFAMASTVTGPCLSTRAWAPVRSTIVDAACCSEGPASR